MERSQRIQFLFQPARALGRTASAELGCELVELARRSRPDAPLPPVCQPAALAARVLALARSRNGTLRGFASARLLPVRGVGEALHLEAVRALDPEREGLSARLTLAVVRGYCLRFSFPARLWLVFDGSGPCRLGDAVDCEQALGASLAVDEVARRMTQPGTAATERWAGWLGELRTPVVCFELAGRVLETGYVSLRTLLASELRQRFARHRWTGAPAPV